MLLFSGTSSTSGFEENHDVSHAAVDLPKVEQSDVAVELERLADRVIHFALAQIWCVFSYSRM